MQHTRLGSYQQRATERILKQCLKDKKITQKEYQQAIASLKK